MSFAFVRKKPQECMYSPTSLSDASAKLSSVGKRSYSAGVTMFTRASVH